MTELEGRIIASRVVEELRTKGQTPREIFVGSDPAGLCVRVELDGPVVQCVVPPGYFDYGRVAEVLILARGRCVLEVT